jgi:hypothetical protein
MPTFIAVYYSGMIITNEIGSYEFVGMKETFLLNEFLSLENLVDLVRGWLGWIDEGCEVRFEGQNDIGLSNGPRMKTMSPICKEKEWTTYIGVMTKSKIHGIALVARMVGRNDVGGESSRSSTLPEVVDEWHVKCGIVLMQPSQETRDDTDADEPTFIASNEKLLNMEPVSGSVSVGDVVADAGFISGVDPQPSVTGFTLDVDPFSASVSGTCV